MTIFLEITAFQLFSLSAFSPRYQASHVQRKMPRPTRPIYAPVPKKILVNQRVPAKPLEKDLPDITSRDATNNTVSRRNKTIMLDDIRNTAGDLLSGKMKEAEIALTKQESAILRLKIEGLIDEGTKLRDERVILISKLEIQRLQLAEKDTLIADLTAQLRQREPVAERLEEPAHEVLKILFKASDGLDIGSIRSHVNMEEGVVRFHVGVLVEGKFIGFKKRVLNFAGASTNIFYIHQKGREYVMKNG